MVLPKLNRLVEIYEQAQPIADANGFIGYIKPKLRQRFKPCFVKAVFDRTANGLGAVFIKFASHPWNGACNEDLEKSNLNFIISIDGFDGDGKIDENSVYTVEMFKYRDANKRYRRMAGKKFYNFEDARAYVDEYFSGINEDVTAVATGTASGATSAGVGGPERTEGNIAVKPYHAGLQRRFKKKVRK